MNRSTAESVLQAVAATTGLAAAALSHLGWWLDWQTRTRVGQGCRPVD